LIISHVSIILTYEEIEDIVDNNSKTTVIRPPTVWLTIIINSTRKSNFYHFGYLPKSINFLGVVT